MDTPQLPAEFLESCSQQERDDVTRWWANLEQANRSEIAVLLDQRCDRRAYIYDDKNARWQTIPIEYHHLESDDDPHEFERERNNQWLQHIFNHPELMENWDVTDMAIRSFHICTNHPRAIQTRERGVLGGDFSCPNGDGTCPIADFAQPISFGIMLTSDDRGTLTTWLCQRNGHAM